jgi:hypothetical protein
VVWTVMSSTWHRRWQTAARGAVPPVTACGGRGVSEVHNTMEALKDMTGGHYAHRWLRILVERMAASLCTSGREK